MSKGKIAATGLLMLVVGCGDGPTAPVVVPPESPRSSAGTFMHDGALVEVEVEVLQPYLEPDDALTIGVTVRNLSEQEASFTFADGCAFFYSIRALDGTSRSPGWFCTFGVVTIDLPAGDTLSETFQWDGRAYSDEGVKERVRPGLYEIRGWFARWTGPVLVGVRD